MSVVQIEAGSVLEGKITGITKYGAFVALPGGKSGMVHISEVSTEFVREIRDFLTENQQVRVKVISIDENGKIALSLKRVHPEEGTAEAVSAGPPAASAPSSWKAPPKKSLSSSGDPFEDMMSKFKSESEEKISDLKKSLEVKKSSPGFTRKNSGRR